MTMNKKEIIGEGGGKGGGGSSRSAVEAPNTLRSSAVVRVVEVISEGEIVGICGGAQGIYLNDTPLQSSSGSYNFPRAGWDYRVGLPNQDYMPGYSAVESEATVGATVTVGLPATRTTTSTAIDAVKVTIQLSSGLYSQDVTNGDINGASVTFAIDVKLTSSGAWLSAGSYTIDGKTTSPYERQYRVNRPAGTGTWDIRVTRSTADSTTAALKNGLTWARITEIQEVKDETVEYNDTAVVGLAIDAETVGNSIPKRSYLVKGLKIQIPSNYNPVTRVYTGQWNGTFQTAWTDNPAWVLYDLLTNARYGLGEFISSTQIDKYSFYDAAVYSDELVSDGAGSTEPRYTFNGIINQRNDALRVLQSVAGTLRGQLVYFNGLITLLQDRPADPVMLITKANVLDGVFNYKSSGLFERHSAVNVTYNDRTDRHLQKIVTVDATTTTGSMQTALQAAQNKYGYNSLDIAAFGAVSESQALRHGRWTLDTELNQTEVAMWNMSLNGFALMPGDIVKVYDEDYTSTVGGGRIVSVSGTTVVLDRAVTLSAGSTIEVLLADGKTMQSKAITQTSGTLSTITVASTFAQSVLAGADYIVTTTASPRQFKIIAIKQDDKNTVSVEAIYHDPNKYARVEAGLDIAAPVFSNAVQVITSAPLSLSFKESGVNVDNTIKRSLLISWNSPAQGVAVYYTVMWRMNSGNWNTITEIKSISTELSNIQGGLYDVRVFAHSAYGNQSEALEGSYSIVSANGGVSNLNAPTTLVEQNGGGTAFTTNDLNFKWTNPASNATITTATLRDFEVRIVRISDSAVLRTYYVAPVAAGGIQNSSYAFSTNLADNANVATRSIKVEVRCRDTNGNLSAAVSTTFTNPAPITVTGLTCTGGFSGINVKWNTIADLDLGGYLVWRDTTAGFTPSSGNLIADTPSNMILSGGLADSTTYYFKVAGYDSFMPEASKASGTGLNISSVASATTLAPANTNEYQLNGITWTPNSPSANSVSWTACTAVKTQGTGLGSTWSVAAGSAAWTSGILYIYYTEGATTLSSTTTITNAVATNKIIVATYRGGTNLEHGDGKAYIDGSYVIAGTIGASQLVVGSAVITEGAQIANATITDAHFTGLLTANKIDARGLSIKDANGNIILSAGTALSSSYVTPDSGWLNSNLTPSITAAQTTANTAVSTATTASTAASTALTTANTAVSTATTASTTANTAVSTANTASTAASNAATAAATAQSTANAANTAASNAATAAATAQSTANAAATAASNAATAASNAQTSANTANTAITNMSSDNILSPVEKPEVVLKYAAITSEQSGIDSQATSFAITTEKTAYDNAVSALTTYLNGLSGWNTIPGSNVTIVGTTFRTKFNDVYTTKQALLNAISAKAKTLADSAATTASSAATAASTAQSTANTANTAASTAATAAATAQSTANSANTAASNAATAAATAQSTANSANTAASNAATAASNAASAAATAQTTANAAATAASNAATAASNAQTSANTANTAISDMASDNILSPVEKPDAVLKYAAITGEKSGIDSQATSFAITTEKTAYDNAVSALTTYLNGLTGWNTIPGSNVTIVGTTFRQKFNDVYTTKQALLNAISAKAKTLADSAATTASSAATAASSAATAAATAQSTANTANTAASTAATAAATAQSTANTANTTASSAATTANTALTTANNAATAASNAATAVSNISISSDGVLSGGGGGSVSLVGLGAGSMARINQITGANISTYISSAAITDAYIGSISAGKINAGTMDASYISAGTITTDRLVANAVTAVASGGGGYVYYYPPETSGLGSFSTGGLVNVTSSGTPLNIWASMQISVQVGRATPARGISIEVRMLMNGVSFLRHFNVHSLCLSYSKRACTVTVPMVLRYSFTGTQTLSFEVITSFLDDVYGSVVAPGTGTAPFVSMLTSAIIMENKV